MGKKKKKENDSGGEEEEDPDAFVFSKDPVIADVQRKVMTAFDVFDSQNLKMVDVREVGTMSRALELYPSEVEVNEIIGIVEDSTMKGMVKQKAFIEHLTKIICEGKYKPVPHADLVAAFKALDKDNKGVFEPAKFKEMLLKEGETFTAEEVDEMFNFGLSKTDGQLHWEDYVDRLYRNLRVA